MKQATFDQFAQQGFNRIPVFRRVLADLETPLSALRKLAQDGPYSFLFESVFGGERWGRYSILGLPARERIEVRGKQVQRFDGDRCLETVEVDDPLQWIADFKAQFKVPDLDGLPRVGGGLVGYFGYDTVRYIEPRLADSMPEDRLGQPDIVLLVADEIVVFDRINGSLHLVVHTPPDIGLDAARARLDELEQLLAKGLETAAPAVSDSVVTEADFESEFEQQAFEAAVDRIKEYIVAGDAMQVVLAQRMSVPYAGQALDVYRALRHLNPSPYMFYLNMGSFQIVGSSPEILTRLEDGTVTVRPIAGTRPRGKDEAEDNALEKDLLADPKELAEHLMLIDLGRNDVGRVAEVGSVNLTEKMIIERYSHVMHIVSNVEGQIRPEYDAISALRATFPAGTVSGAPKVRAMEIIDELEPVKRGVYAGAVGYLGWNGNMDTAIAIRTAVVQEGRLYIEAGAGIVADSVPRNEWDETMNKGRAMFRAVALAQRGLSLGEG